MEERQKNRSFIAVDLNVRETREKIAELSREIRNIGDQTQVNPEKYHITLAFLGDVRVRKLEHIEKRLEGVKKTGFTVNIDGIGVFPSKDFIKVVWVGAKSEELTKLHQEVEKKLPKEFRNDKEFVPHITVTRVKRISEPGKKQLKKLLDTYKDYKFGSIEVKKFKLKESVFKNGEVVHNTLNEYELG